MQPENYIADTVDLTRDDEARDYWLACFEDSLPKVRLRITSFAYADFLDTNSLILYPLHNSKW